MNEQPRIFVVANKEDGTLIGSYKFNWELEDDTTEDIISGHVTFQSEYMDYFQKKLKSIIISKGSKYYSFFFFENKEKKVIVIIGVKGLGILKNREDIEDKIEKIDSIYELKQPYKVDESAQNELGEMIKLSKLNKNFIKTGIDMTAIYIHKHLRDIDKNVILSILSNVVEKDNDNTTRQQVLNKLCELMNVSKNNLKDILSVFIGLRDLCAEIAGLNPRDKNIKAYVEFEHKHTGYVIGIGPGKVK